MMKEVAGMQVEIPEGKKRLFRKPSMAIVISKGETPMIYGGYKMVTGKFGCYNFTRAVGVAKLRKICSHNGLTLDITIKGQAYNTDING